MDWLRELPEHETPRGRIREVGPVALSDIELLAILLRNGVTGTNVFDLAKLLLATHGGWRGLMAVDHTTLCQYHGIGEAKAATIIATFEVARRLAFAQYEQRVQIKNPSDIAQLLLIEMGHLDHEELRTVLLDTKNRILAIVTVYVGSVHTSMVRPGEVFKEAVRRNAVSIIVAHNHPSGDPDPSQEDIIVTRDIVQSGKILDTEVMDHIIIGHGRWVSLRERGLGFN